MKKISIIVWTPVLAPYMKDQQNEAIRTKRAKKSAKQVWQLFYFFVQAIYGYTTLKEIWLPSYLGGNASWDDLWNDAPFVKSCPGASTYALIQLGYHGGDFLSLIFLEERQHDFLEMAVHHLSTFGLITSMILANFLPIGCIVTFLHDVSDCPVSAIRILSNCADCVKSTLAVFSTTIITWFYTRNVCLSYIVWRIWNEVKYQEAYVSYDPIIKLSALFLSFLVVLQWYWLWMFLQCLIYYKKTGTTEDLQNKSKSVSVGETKKDA